VKDLNLSLKKGKKPNYLKVAEAVREKIISGELTTGEDLPSTRLMARHLQLHRHTVMAALSELVAEGWIEAKQRKTYFVSDRTPNFFSNIGKKAKTNKSETHPWRFVRSVSDEFLWEAKSSPQFVFKNAAVDSDLFPRKEFRSHLLDAAKFLKPTMLNYGDPAGHPRLVDAIKTYLRRARAITEREIVIVNGSQEGIFLASQLLLQPGDKVAVEGLGYRSAWEAMRVAGAELLPVAVDEHGMNLDSLEKLLKQHQIRMIYTTPLHQYPTTVTLPTSRRLRLYELAHRYSIPILEDDYDHEFHYRTQPLTPLASNDPFGLVIYVSTFSKSLFPGARVGFVAVPKSLYQPFVKFRRIVTRQNEIVLQDAVARWIYEGGFERHLRRMRRAFEERRHQVITSLELGRARGLDLSWVKTDGGMAVWADFGVDANRLAKKCFERGVSVTPEAHFQLTPSPGRHLHLAFASQTPQQLKTSMEIILESAHAFK
jgi:GntR family transcriptional regulator / MocR family aminotransferase